MFEQQQVKEIIQGVGSKITSYKDGNIWNKTYEILYLRNEYVETLHIPDKSKRSKMKIS